VNNNSNFRKGWSRPGVFAKLSRHPRPAVETLEDRLVPSHFVQALYGEVLGRPAGTAEESFWTSQIQSGPDRTNVATGIFNSPEARTLQVDDYYARFFRRAADPAGEKLWANLLVATQNEQVVIVSFVGSPEYQGLHPTNTDFLGSLYAAIFSRAPGNAEVSFWGQALLAGASRANVAQGFLTSSENYQNAITAFYQNYLGAAPPPASLSSLVTQLQSGQLTLTAAAIQILGSQQYFDHVGNYQFFPETMVEPPVIASKNGILKTTIVEKTGTAMFDGHPVSGLSTYDGIYAGPTLHVNPGEALNFTLQNLMATDTNVHTHGLHVSPLGNSDNVLDVDIKPGQSFTYYHAIPPDHPQGLYWFHPHMMPFTDEQVYDGSAGLLVIGSPDGGAPELGGLKQRLLALKNINLTPDGSALAPESLPPGADPGVVSPIYSVNGHVNSTMTIAPGESQVWSVGNIGNDPFFDLKLDGHTLYVVAEDGQPYTQARPVQDLVVPPGKRFSFVVQGGNPGTYQLRTMGFDSGHILWPAGVLATLVTEGPAGNPILPPTTLTPPANYFHDMSNATIAKTRTEVFNQGLDPVTKQFMFTVNGEAFPNVTPLIATLGTTEEWILVNKTHDTHPFHIHQNNFQVMDINGVAMNTGTLEDTVDIPPQTTDAQGVKHDGEVRIRMEFLDFLGSYVFHCHILHHEDMGMMGIVTVVAPS
jgi:FtsP/CotA-like multicopper oxidase with cupredoxin domain